MGADLSAVFTGEKKKKKKVKGERFYKPPDKRLKERFDPEENLNFTSQLDAAIDKYDYLIVFPITEGQWQIPKLEKTDRISDRVIWQEVKRAWHEGCPGTEEDKEEAIENLATFWKKRCGLYPEDDDELLRVAWLTVAREAIIDTLMKKSGLQLKLSAIPGSISCRLRAPLKLLELQADKENYRLQFRGEIDPGSNEFWNREVYKKLHGKESMPEAVALEIEDERAVYSKDQANAILDRLYKAGKIPPEEMYVNPDFETPALWSRRVHALERVADKVPVTNKYCCAYDAFTVKPTSRYLFAQYPSVRGKTLFRSKDRLFLTKSVIDACFDLDKFKEFNLVTAFMALHDSNRGDKLNIDALQRKWVWFWMASASDAGSACVSSPAYEDDAEVWFYERPFAQPLGNIRDYFGEKIALYYAWLGYYGYMLVIPAVFGSVMVWLMQYRGWDYPEGEVDWYMVGFLVLIIAWAAAYKQGWEQETRCIALKWGTRGFEDIEKNRPQFFGDPENPLERSSVTGNRELHYPDEKRWWIVSGNLVFVFVVIIFDLAIFGAIFYAENLVYTQYPEYEFPFFDWAVMVFVALSIEICSKYYVSFSTELSENENHQTQTKFEDSLILKTLIFKLVNHNAALMIVAFVKSNFDVLGDCTHDTCVEDVKQLIWAIFIVRLFINLLELFWPIVSYYLGACSGFLWGLFFAKSNEGTANENAQLTSDEGNVDYLREVWREDYESPFHDYAEAVIQFGYLNMYSVVLPYISLIALGETCLKIRMDAFKLCSLMRRPHVSIAEDVGGWAALMDMMSILGVVNSVAILTFAEDDVSNFTLYEKLIAFLATEQLLLMFKFWVHSLIPDEADWVADIAARNSFIVEKFAKGFEDAGDDLELGALKGQLDETIDADAMDLSDFRENESRKAFHIANDQTEVTTLQQQRRALLKALQEVKDDLQDVYRKETFNTATGVGESKSGVPLGKVSLRLILVKFPHVEMELLGPSPAIQIRVLIKATKVGAPPPGPPTGPRNYSVVLDQETLAHANKTGEALKRSEVGPFAPISTQEAEVVFDVLDKRPGKGDALLGSTSIRLKELQDQESHDLSLHFKMRQQNGDLIPTEAHIDFNILFQFSKAQPIRARIAATKEALRQVELDLARLKAGLPRETEEGEEGGGEETA